MATLRQKKRARLIGKNSTTEAELLAAGYAPSTAKHQPPSVTKAKGWIELVEEYLPDDDVLGAHKEALEATKTVSAKIITKGADSQTDDFIDVPDYPTRLKAVELSYKVKKQLGTDAGVKVQVNNFIPILGGATKDVQSDDSNQ